MKKTILCLMATGLMIGSLAKAEVNMSDAEFDAALNRAMIKADVKVFCGTKGQEFTKEMATSLRQLSNATLNQNIESQAKNYEGLCDKSIKTAFSNGLSEAEIRELLQSK